ncbi:MAG: DUF4386 domain-containing protein [Jatrophihabitantaceae bacterium]
MTVTTARSVHRSGAPLWPPTISYAVLTLCGATLPSAMAGKGPWQSDSALLDFFANHGAAAHASAFFTFGAAVPLAVVTAVSTTRLRLLGLDVPGRIIAQLGGVLAAAMLAISGLTTLALTQPHVAESPAAVRAVYGITFAMGGPGFVVFVGLLLLGLSISSLFGNVLPRWLAWVGVAVAIACEASAFSVAFSDLQFLLPIGRFGSLAWLVVTGFLLPSSRRELRQRRGEVRAADVG